MTTFTASLHQSQPRKVHAGMNVASSKITIAVTGTASSVVLLAKIPNGAVIHDFTMFVDDAGADNVWKLGLLLPEGVSGSTTVTESALMSDTASTLAPTMRATGGKLPYKVSFTDTERFAWIQAVATIAISASADLRFSVYYTVGEDF